jgi:hypothetical protein
MKKSGNIVALFHFFTTDGAMKISTAFNGLGCLADAFPELSDSKHTFPPA